MLNYVVTTHPNPANQPITPAMAEELDARDARRTQTFSITSNHTNVHVYVFLPQ